MINGTCCSDFNDCNEVTKYNKENKCKLENCKLCDYTTTLGLCYLCDNFFFNRNGICVKNCEKTDIIDQDNNYICYPQPEEKKCEIKGCKYCEEGKSKVCKKCMRGFYKLGDKCLKTCPENYRADRMSWLCLKIPIFAFYWVYPSVISCKGRCGKLLIDSKSDCS